MYYQNRLLASAFHLEIVINSDTIMQQLTNGERLRIRSNHSHRTLLRTENSLEKVVDSNRDAHLRKFRQLLHHELRVSSQEKQKLNQSHKIIISHLPIRPRQKTNLSGKAGMFKKAHLITRHQTFLCTTKKEKKKRLVTMTDKPERERAETEGNRSSGHLNRQLSYQKSEIGPSQMKYRTINFEHERSEIDKITYVPHSARNKHQQAMQMRIKKKEDNQIQSSIPTVRKGVQADQSAQFNRLQSLNQPIPLNNQHRNHPIVNQPQPQSIIRQLFQPSNIQQPPNADQLLQTIPKAPIDPTISFSEQPTNISKPIEEVKTIDRANLKKQKPVKKEKSSSSKKNIYQEVEETDIEQIRLGCGTFNLKDNPPNQASEQPAKEPAKPQNIYLASPYKQPPISQKSLQNGQNLPQRKQTDSNPSTMPVESNKKRQIQKAQPPKSTDISNKKDNKQKKKAERMSNISKISQLRANFELLGELATYFSTKSKTFKYSESSKDFLRKETVTWHLLVYLFFKYFYSMSIFFEQYYKASSNILSINQTQLNHFAEENELWAVTITKFQKSVKKNTKLEKEMEDFITNQDYLDNLKNSESLEKMGQYYLGGIGVQNCCQFGSYMEQLRLAIWNEAIVFIKNLHLGNILSNKNSTSSTFYEGTFRIFNSCIILAQWHCKSQQILSPFINLQSLTDPPLQMFKSFYSRLTQHILIKQP